MEFGVEIFCFGATGCVSVHSPFDHHCRGLGLLQSSPSTALGVYVIEFFDILVEHYIESMCPIRYQREPRAAEVALVHPEVAAHV